MHFKFRSAAAIILAVVTALSCLLFTACAEKDPQDEQNPVILKYGDLKLRKFCFDSLYATNDNYYMMSQGAISMSEYFNLVAEETGRYAVTLKAARAKGYQLTEEEEQNVIASRDAQWEHIKQVFIDKIDEDITDEQARQEEFERLFVLETGYSSELYFKCLEETLRDRELIQRYFEEQTAGLEPTDEQVAKYIDIAVNNQSTWAFSTFAQRYVEFGTGVSSEPSLFVPKDCFTVVQYLIPADASADKQAEAEAEIAKCTAQQLISGFFAEDNAAEEMQSELFRGMGYPIHESIDGNYSKEFVFAAYRASGKKGTPGTIPADYPEYTDLKTSDGRLIVKVTDEEGVHYVMQLKKLTKGNISYSKGDEIWQYGYEGAKAKLCRNTFDEQIEKEYQKAVKKNRLTWYYDRFRSGYLPSNNID